MIRTIAVFEYGVSFGSSQQTRLAKIPPILDKFADDRFKGDPYVSLFRAEVPANFPSVHITAAGCDGLRDEGIAYALKLRDAGVDAQLEIVPGAPHELTLSPTANISKQFYRNQARVLNVALNTDL